MADKISCGYSSQAAYGPGGTITGRSLHGPGGSL